MDDAARLLMLVDVVIGVALLEAVVLAAWHGATGRGPAIADLLANLAAGLCLLAALRSVLAGASWTMCALWLVAAGAAHALDLARRWPTRRVRPPSSSPTS